MATRTLNLEAVTCLHNYSIYKIGGSYFKADRNLKCIFIFNIGITKVVKIPYKQSFEGVFFPRLPVTIVTYSAIANKKSKLDLMRYI